jgi:ankyrin repeat protein
VKKIALISFMVFFCQFQYLTAQAVSYREQNGGLLRVYSIMGDMTEVKAVIGRGDVYVDSMDKNGFTALMYAALYGHVKIMEYLLAAKESKALEADINLVGEASGFTPLMLASMNGKLPAVKFLIEKGVKLNTEDKNGFTALIFAAGNNHYEVARYLVEKGTDVNIATKGRWTALKWAKARGFQDIVAFLKSKNAK